MKPMYLAYSLRSSALVLFTIIVSLTNSALSQSSNIAPDNTLGVESSTVTTRDENSDSINGGALRGSNLFHSFEEFNVGEGRGVYFANPDDVTNIFSRVTGNNVSNILGTLGVDGAADLFLINPNGILFGENASLDVQSSFTATTANGIEFGENGLFSATNPDQSSLLTVNPDAFFYNQVANEPGNIINQANLVTGQDLTLDANNLDLQGQTLAARNLTLSALDTVKIRDSIDDPFIGAARGNLLIRGNKTVDIFTLGHPESGLFSGQDLVLQSANPVGGDAHFWSGGNFRIEQLDSNLGDLNSPYDPIIRSFGDVSFNNYAGASLHILAGGSVNAGIIFIEAAETEIENIDFIQETIQLSNETEVFIDGSKQPTLDIRAGMNPDQILDSGVTGENITTDTFLNSSFISERPTLTNSSNSGDINVDFITMLGENAANGLVFITNNYKSSSSISEGSIKVNTIATDDTAGGLLDVGFVGNGGSVIIDSRENILVENSINTTTRSGQSGDITLLALEDINIAENGRIDASLEGQGIGGNILVNTEGNLFLGNAANITTNVTRGAIGAGGNIDIQAGSFTLDDAFLDISTFGQGDAGEININVNDSFVLKSSNIYNNLEQEATGNTGGIEIEAELLSLEDNSGIFNQIKSPALVKNSGIQINASSLSLDSTSLIDSSIFEQGQGQAGDILIDVNSLSLDGASQIGSGVAGQGQAGDIVINANDFVSLVGDAKLFQPDFSTAILARIQPNGEGSAGNIVINTESLSVSGAQITASVQGEGNAGNISLQADDSIAISNESGIFSSVDSGGEGSGGEINIDSKSLSIEDGSQILTIIRGASELNSLPGKGNAGDININVSDALTISGLLLEDGTTAGFIASSVTPGAEGMGGDINIKAGDVVLNNFASFTSSLDPTAIGESGNINIEANSLSLSKNSEITAVTEGTGKAGNIDIDTGEFVSLVDSGIFSSALRIAEGDGGDIQIDTSSLSLEDGSRIDAVSTSVNSKAGNIDVNAFDITLRDDSDISTLAFQNFGEGGNITLTADSIVAFDDSDIFAFAEDGRGGNITLDTPAFFAENFTLNSLTANPDLLENNDRADVNATGAVSGAVDIPDVSFIQNGLTELTNNSIDTDELVANSCVSPVGNRQQGRFIITGGDSLPVRPGNASVSNFATGEVQSVPQNNSWQPGDPIIEPQGVYRLTNGKLVLSRECN